MQMQTLLLLAAQMLVATNTMLVRFFLPHFLAFSLPYLQFNFATCIGFAGTGKSGNNGHGSGGIGTIHGEGMESHGGTTKSPSTPRSLHGMESGTIIGGKMEETATTGLVDVEEKANRENALYGSAMLGRLLGDNIAHSLRQHSSTLLKSGDASGYALSGAAVPYPFGVGPARPARGVGVDGGPWLPPAPSVSSLQGKQPGSVSL